MDKDNQKSLILMENNIRSLETRLKTIELGLSDLQGGNLNMALALGTLLNTLIEEKVITVEKLETVSKKIKDELLEENAKNKSESEQRDTSDV